MNPKGTSKERALSSVAGRLNSASSAAHRVARCCSAHAFSPQVLLLCSYNLNFDP